MYRAIVYLNDEVQTETSYIIVESEQPLNPKAIVEGVMRSYLDYESIPVNWGMNFEDVTNRTIFEVADMASEEMLYSGSIYYNPSNILI